MAEVVMPQLGETVTEGTVLRWLKQPGERVGIDEPICEISTDKVDAELPSAFAGVVRTHLVAEGETVPIGTPLAVVDVDVAAPGPGQPSAAPPAPAPAAAPAPAPAPAPAAAPAPAPAPAPAAAPAPAPAPVAARPAAPAVPPAATAAPTRPVAAPPASPAPPGEVVPFDHVRRRTAVHLRRSLDTAAHTLVAVEVDFEAVERARLAHRDAVRESRGVALTYLAFVARAVIDALAEFPRLNATVTDDAVVVHDPVNLGISVDLAYAGLVVPVVRDADRLGLVDLAVAMAERAEGARARRLGADDYALGTFTITNAGGYGTLLTGPIIHGSQAAILSTDGVVPKPVAVADPTTGGHAVAVHHVGNLSLSFDHRANDGAYCSAFLARVRDILEARDWAAECDPAFAPTARPRPPRDAPAAPVRPAAPAGAAVRAEPAPGPGDEAARLAAIATGGARPVEVPPDSGAGHATYMGFARHELIEDFRLACVSRAIDDREIALQRQARVFFQISGAGHEALALGLARYLRPAYDWFFPYYRDQALVLGLGVSAFEVLLQAVGSADDPSSAGRQMPSHWGSRRLHIVTQSSPTGSQCIPAVGCAEAGRYLVRRPHLGLSAHGDEVTYVSLGEGACSEGEFWESLNSACTLHLPVLFVVPDNGYAISVPTADQQPAPVSELVRGFRGLQVHHLDGTDYLAVRREAAHIVAQVRAGVGPALVHATVTRPYSHSGADTQAKYRTPDELAYEAAHDPITRLEAALVQGGVLTAAEAAEVREDAKRHVADAAAAALATRRPDPAEVTHHVVALPALPRPGEPGTDAGVVALGEAISRTLHEQMGADERIRVFGEDVADAREAVLANVEGKGGVFGTTHGLQRTFGTARCYNTPLAEANIIGRAVGQAVRGLHPAPEIQFFDYIWPAMQQLRSEAATIRWRSAGSWSCPMVVRVPIGGYLRGGAIWHSQSGESIFAHCPGLLIAFPSRARDAAGLLRYAFRCDDPVLFLEHKHLLRQPYTRDPFPGPDWVLPFGVGDVRRPGRDLTIVTWGATVQKSLEAAERLGADGTASIEVVDLRTIAPWDRALVGESVQRTRRLLVVHEDAVTAGFGAEVAAWAADELWDMLEAPVRRVGALDTPVAYEPTLEDAILPQVDGILAAAAALARHGR